jgi:hypothetical protein
MGWRWLYIWYTKYLWMKSQKSTLFPHRIWPTQRGIWTMLYTISLCLLSLKTMGKSTLKSVSNIDEYTKWDNALLTSKMFPNWFTQQSGINYSKGNSLHTKLYPQLMFSIPNSKLTFKNWGNPTQENFSTQSLLCDP